MAAIKIEKKIKKGILPLLSKKADGFRNL